MSVKLLTSTVTGLDAFCHDPLGALCEAEKETVAVLHNNTPAFYVLTPDRLAQLLALEKAQHTVSGVMPDMGLSETVFSRLPTGPAAVGKFTLTDNWRPDADFLRQAAIWGIALQEPVTETELAAFIAWWQADGRMFHHIQWQQKLARSIQQSRAASGGKARPDINQLPEPDRIIPDGFRGA